MEKTIEQATKKGIKISFELLDERKSLAESFHP